MPDAIPVDVCKAIATSLAGASFSKTISVDRLYIPAYKAEDLQSTIKVAVVNNGYRRDTPTRSRSLVVSDIQARIFIQTKVDANDVADVDELVYLVEEIHEHLEQNTFSGASYVPESNTLPDVLDIFDPDELKNKGLFFAQIDVNLRKAG